VSLRLLGEEKRREKEAGGVGRRVTGFVRE
jgi:hypothetical protein